MNRLKWLSRVLFIVFGVALTSQAQGVPSQIDAALADLSNRVGQTITLENGTLSNWQWAQEDFGDASLGCPTPGRIYAQVVTPGYIFTLTYQGTIYDYRVSLDGSRVILCEETSTSAPTPTPVLEEQYSNPLCPSATTETGPYPRSRVSMGTVATGTLAVNRLREQPNTTAPVITEIPQGAVFIVSNGPECDADGIVWWQVDFDGVIGWTAEAEADERYIVPRQPDSLSALPVISPENGIGLSSVGELQGNLETAFAISPDGSNLVALGATGSDALVLYDLNNIAAQPRYIDSDVDFVSLDYHPSGSQLLMGGADGGIYLWNLFPDAPLLEALFLQTHIADTRTVAVTPDGQGFASAGTQALTTATENTTHTALLWDFQTVAQVAAFDDATDAITQLEFSPDGTRLAAVVTSGDLLVWSVDAPQTPLLAEADTGARAIAYSSNRQFLAVGRSSGAIDVLDANNGILVTTLNGHLGAINDLAFSPDNRLLASVSDDGTVRLWNTQSDANITTLEINATLPASQVAFASTGNLIVVSVEDGTLSLLGVQTP